MPSKMKTKAKKPRKRKPPKARRKTAKLRAHCRCTLTLIAKVAKIVGEGNFRTSAFSSLGIPEGTWWKWVSKGNRELREFSGGSLEPKNMTLFADLVLALEKAEGKCTIGVVRNVMAAKTEDGRPDIRAQEWLMERRHNKLFTRNPAAVVDGEAQHVEDKPRGREILLGRILVALGRNVGGGDDA